MKRVSYLFIALGVLFLFSLKTPFVPEALSPIVFILSGVFLFVGGFVRLRLHRAEEAAAIEAAKEAEEREKAQKKAARQEAIAREKAAAEQKQAAWEATHGRIFTKVVGVTFNNDDGTSRQDILREAYAEDCDGRLALQVYYFEGKECVSVLYDDMCIGVIPSYNTSEVIKIMKQISAMSLNVEAFIPDDDDDPRPEKIYRADLSIVYLK